jgi:threonine-phosphate decarboxylase
MTSSRGSGTNTSRNIPALIARDDRALTSTEQTGPVSRRPDEIPPAGAHGGDGHRVAAALGVTADDVLDLSASLNPFAPDVVVLARDQLTSLRRYPDVDEAERIVAEMIGTEDGRLVLTAGGSQAIALVADRLGDGWVDEPDFSLYRRHLRRLSPGAPPWRSDPHNPSGTLADWSGNGAGEDVMVWDEAFLPMSAGTWTRDRPGWALGSLTKAFACPGLRLGFAVAPTADDAARLRQRRPAWAVSGLACALLPQLAELADPPGWTRQIAAARESLAGLLRAHGLQPLPSSAPWLLVDCPSPKEDGTGADSLAEPRSHPLRAALARHAVVVRDCASFGLPSHVRIAVPDEQGLHRLDHALQRVQPGTRTSHGV